MLRAKDIDTLVLLGIITSGVVLSTALDAMDQDYRVLIVRDACAARADCKTPPRLGRSDSVPKPTQATSSSLP
jgi:isochorismate hydrolase